jgi:hypothetical protein
MGPLYWSESNLQQHEQLGALGQRVYIRTNAPPSVENAEETVYRITIDKE